MRHTTHGSGPFKPKLVQSDGEEWILDKDYANEDEAALVAFRMLNRLEEIATNHLDAEGWIAI